MPENLLIARFPVEKGPVIRVIIERYKHLFYSIRWEQEEPLHSGKFTGGLARPDTDDEGSQNRFWYDADKAKTLMEREGASVVL